MICDLICTGTELLLGKTLNTNSQYFCEAFAEYGLDINKVVTIGDNKERLLETLEEAQGDIIFLNGGLGPTEDDLTRETLVEFLGIGEEVDPVALEKIIEYSRRQNRQPLPGDLKVGNIPAGSRVFANRVGAAPGSMSEKNGKFYILTPGPPKELMVMMEEEIMPYLKERFSLNAVIYSKTYRVFSLGEARSESLIKDLIKSGNPTVAPTVKGGETHYRITGKGQNLEEATELVESMSQLFEERLGSYIVGVNEKDLRHTVGAILKEKDYYVSAAESCTGGTFIGALTDIAGSSAYVNGGFITYTNKAKIEMLNVDEGTLAQHGAVSEEVALEMVKGVYEKTGSEVCVSITGIAGPEGGSIEKPVGLVYIGLGVLGDYHVYRYVFFGERNEVRERTVKQALFLIHQYFKEG